jgi:succinoglycan biosynthesis transport protein ExoP
MAARQALEQDDFAAEPRSLDLRDYWKVVRRRWRLVVVAALIGPLAGAGYAVAKGPTYTATAEVVVAAVTQGPLSQSTQATSQVNMSTEQAIAQSAPVIQQAAAIMRVPFVQLEKAVAKRLSVTVPASTLTTSNVLQLNWQASSPQAAQQGANAFATAYLAYRHHELASQIAVLQTTLQQQTSSLRAQIMELSSELSRAAGPATRRTLTIRLNELSDQASTAEAQLAALPTYNNSGGSMISAALPNRPSGFTRSVLIAIGLILGLLVGLALAFIRDIFDDRVRDVTQFEQRLGAIILAELPPVEAPGDRRDHRPAGRSQPTPAVMIATSPDSRAADASRALRASVVAVSSRRNLRVLLVVATDPSMSASRVAAELGVALAESGRRVLLMASDLRGSALPQIFDVPDRAGLSELLISGGDPEVLTRRPRQASGALLSEDVAEWLAVLPSGQRTMNALSILDSGRMLDLLQDQREAYGFVLLDAPPATAADIMSLASNVDGVIVLARESHTRGRDVEALRHRLDQLGVPVVGGVWIGGRRPARSERMSTAAEPVRRATIPEQAMPAPQAAQVRPPFPSAAQQSGTRPLPTVPGDAARSSTPSGAVERPL